MFVHMHVFYYMFSLLQPHPDQTMASLPVATAFGAGGVSATSQRPAGLTWVMDMWPVIHVRIWKFVNFIQFVLSGCFFWNKLYGKNMFQDSYIPIIWEMPMVETKHFFSGIAGST